LDEDFFALTSATDRRKRSPVGTVYNDSEKTFPVTDDILKRLRSIPTAKLANVAADEIERLQVENDEQNEDIIRLLAEVARLRKAGDELVTVISNCECVTNERCGWCIAKDKWEEARND
jgi:predicted nuclease with TOPRIM domain